MCERFARSIATCNAEWRREVILFEFQFPLHCRCGDAAVIADVGESGVVVRQAVEYII